MYRTPKQVLVDVHQNKQKVHHDLMVEAIDQQLTTAISNKPCKASKQLPANKYQQYSLAHIFAKLAEL